MEHFTQQEIINILIEMKRVLKKNGKILLFWPHKYGASVIFLKAIKLLYKIIGRSISFHPKEVSLMKNKKMISNICKNTGLKLSNYNFNFRDLFVQTVICLKKDN
jgi:predicted SAM-dependent methyltransferase